MQIDIKLNLRMRIENLHKRAPIATKIFIFYWAHFLLILVISY
jgi:hypothetical protein